jgi:hypothetical protein
MIISLALLLLVAVGETPPFVAAGPAVADCPAPVAVATPVSRASQAGDGSFYTHPVLIKDIYKSLQAKPYRSDVF